MAWRPRPSVDDAVEYLPVESLEAIAERLGVPPEQVAKLDANENPYGPPPSVVAALASLTDLHLYPDPDQRRPRRALAAYTGAAFESILLGNGSDELLDLILLATIEPGDEVIVPVPSFGVYLSRPPLFGARVVTVPRTETFDVDVEAIERALSPRTKLIFLASPNNPTGNLAAAEQVERLLRHGILAVIDEAYFEFAGTTLQSLVERYENVVILRTFSKWAGLAGLRIGYGIFPPPISRALWRVKQPFNVSLAAQVAVEAALADREWLMERVERIRRERDRLYRELQRFPFLQPYPSHANFILCRVHDGLAHRLHAHLLAAAIVVRRYDDAWLRDYLRITVGTPEQSERILEALETFPFRGRESDA
ncbi:MAG: histidinol-phosphate transaminase [Thermomicrobium sp.]|nr:histidinol-phosphate transaminase [Thermomicrobium sp.]